MQFFLLIVFVIFIFVFVTPLIRLIRAIFSSNSKGDNRHSKDNITYRDPTIYDQKIIKKDEGEYVEYEEVEESKEDESK